MAINPYPYSTFIDRSGHPERLVMWIAICLGGGLAVGFLFPADAWYRALNRPWYVPPDWLFWPAWIVAYGLMAYAIFRVECEGPSREVTIARRIFLTQLALNFVWVVLFFGAHRMWLAFLVICGVLVAIGATILVFEEIEPAAARLMVPYGAWVTFACFLTAGFAFLN